MPAQETVRASFFCAGTAARGGSCLRGGLSAGRFVYGMVCLRDCLRDYLRDCLWGGQFAAPESFQGRGQGRNRGTGQGNRETGKQGNGKRETGNGKRETGNGKRETGNGKRETGAEVRSVSGRIGRPIGGRFAGRMFPGRGEWPFLRSPKYLRRISCTVRNNPVYLQVRTEEANR